MDPLMLFPPEVVHEIWIHLRPRDLLACRAVASHWLASVTSCDEAWFTEFSHDWHEFFEMKKTLRRWSSCKVRRSTFKEVKECVFSEVAYYLLFLDGKLEMRSPAGRLVRVFEEKATDIHKRSDCLMVGVDRGHKSGSKATHVSIITDFSLNEIECLNGVTVITASRNGFAFYDHNGLPFFEISGLKMPCRPNEQLHFLDSCVISESYVMVKCFKTISLLDAGVPNPSFNVLNEVTNHWSPHIPFLQILLGPGNYFGACLKEEEEDDHSSFLVFSKDVLLYACTWCFPRFFKEDFLVFESTACSDIFDLSQLSCEQEMLCSVCSADDDHVNSYDYGNSSFCDIVIGKMFPAEFEPARFKNILSEPWSPFKNSLISYRVPAFKIKEENEENRQVDIIVAKLRKWCINDRDTSFEYCAPTLYLSEFRPRFDDFLEFEFVPNYAFRVENHEEFQIGQSENSKVVHLLHFDI